MSGDPTLLTVLQNTQEQHAKFVEAEEKFEALMKEKGREFISGDNLKMAGKLKRKLAKFAKKHAPSCVEINQYVGIAIEEASRRWRGGRRDESARARRKLDFHTGPFGRRLRDGL